MRKLVLVAHNLRSTHNVGSLLRTADGFAAEVWLSGYTPFPLMPDDPRLPHLAAKIDKRIAKTALGAEKSVTWKHFPEITDAIDELKRQGFSVVALEQASGATKLPDFRPPDKSAIIVGREVEGIEVEVLAFCDSIVEIPMLGSKESFNVSVAAAIALYASRFAS
ncbi:MAG TPA: TrmH family RNA methyltransferase [Candidatus Saccharimonadia bacterium]|nr:TrmH family RNA methyltransferase [Candidatus Saccharimonadia bacterium]